MPIMHYIMYVIYRALWMTYLDFEPLAPWLTSGLEFFRRAPPTSELLIRSNVLSMDDAELGAAAAPPANAAAPWGSSGGLVTSAKIY